MMRDVYDAIVIGARCAGSPAAMLLARRGYRVLVVDRATFPSDTNSTHVIHPLGGAALARWGLLERLTATGCPPIHTYAYDFGPVTISGTPGTPELPSAYCPRRTVLDKLLVDAAVEAGAAVREGFTVEEILWDGQRVAGIKGHATGGATVIERAPIVIGADGWYSRLAEAVAAERYHERPPLLAAYYSYWRDLPTDGRFEIYARHRRGFAAMPTHDGLTVLVGGWPMDEFAANKTDVERHFLNMLELAPAFAARVAGARRVSKFAGAAIPNYFRKPYGPGWLLIGDAGYLKDSITAQGITNAFQDAERCAAALDDVFSGRRPFEAAMAEWHRVRDEQALPMYEMTCQLASMEPPPPEMQQLLGAIAGRRRAMDAFVQMNAGTISPADFMTSQHVAAAVGAAQPA
jgi:2-polyprenyl-6-methoxyphenol hydroxylase-like FAD-dependent oxidoreductase